jgi:O-methyltransferase
VLRSGAVWRLVAKGYYVLTVPLATLFILNSIRIQPEYRMTWLRKLWLGWRFFVNQVRIPTASTYKSHLAMALKLLEMPSSAPGVVAECGTWKGGSAANLSLVCKIVRRRLIVFDSFEGLPSADDKDREGRKYKVGEFAGTLAEVQRNIARGGELSVCEFRTGWFDDTLPDFKEPVALVYLDVDLESSLHTCLIHFWPLLATQGYLFTDEYLNIAYCSVFFSESYWRRYFNQSPPGLIGAGMGLALGDFYIGPYEERGNHPAQHSTGAAYTRRDWIAEWTYLP